MPEIVAIQKEGDCLRRMRFRYSVSTPVKIDILERFSDPEIYAVQVFDARHLLPDSKMPFKIQRRDNKFLISGAIGLDYLTATYIKCKQWESMAAHVEAVIRCLH